MRLDSRRVLCLKSIWMLSMLFFVLGGWKSVASAQKSDRIKHLTHEQEGKVRRLIGRFQSEQLRVKELVAAEQAKLDKLYQSYDMDIAKIEATNESIGKLEEGLLRAHLNMHKELRNIVGSEIFEEISKRIKSHMEKQASASKAPTESSR